MAGRPRVWLDAGMFAALNPGLLLLPLFVALPLFFFWLARNYARKAHAELTAFAAQSGLRLLEKTVLGITTVESLEGEQAGRPVRYWSYSTGSGKSRTTWVTVGVTVRGGGALTFDLTRQNFASKLMELFGAREIQVGDPAFDAAWFVRTNQPEFLAAALVPAIRARFMAEAADRRSTGAYKLENGVVRYTEMGSLTPGAVARFAAKLPLLQDLADVAEVSAGPRA